MRKKLPGKIEYAPELIGHFEVVGALTLVKRVREAGGRDGVLLNPTDAEGAERRRRFKDGKCFDVARVHIHPSFSLWNTKFNVPTELADKMRLGKRYKIQCAIVEVKDDAES